MSALERINEIRARESAKLFINVANGKPKDSQLKTDFILVVRHYKCPAGSDTLHFMAKHQRRHYHLFMAVDI